MSEKTSTDTRRISTAGLTAWCRAELARFDAAERTGRVRAIDSTDTEAIVKAARLAIRNSRPGDIEAVITVHGGFVATSYRYHAAGDRCVVRISLIAGASPRWSIDVARASAATRPYGEGDQIIARVRRHDQQYGRIIR
jgi:hypothetical protein